MTQEVSAKLNSLTLEQNIPVAITLELTRRCQLSCRHCYLPETHGRRPAARELGSDAWKKIISQLAAAGGLYLVFTGGEPLLRPDLEELCGHAVKTGFVLKVYSTGVGLTWRRAAALSAAGVAGFEVSLYGRSAVHDSITGCKGSFASSLAACRMAKKAGMKVKLKTVLMNDNVSQSAWLRTLAKREGFGISFDPVIAPANDGGKSALRLRLSSNMLKKAVRLYGPGARRGTGVSSKWSDVLCGAGRNVCAIGPAGELYPCLQLPVKLGALSRGSFADIWKKSPWLKKWRSAGIRELKKCAACSYIESCSRCPGISLIEEGDILAPNKPACTMAKVMALYK